jgi:hypothetical protein
MPYVRRDATGQVIALSSEALEGFEEAQLDAAEFAEFELRLGDAKARLQESDRDVVRVLDDLVNLLIDKNLIRFTDLPAAAQRKLIERRGLRETGSHLGLLGDDSGLL